MDVNETLRLARESAHEVISARADDRDESDPRSNDLELAEQFLALDEWLTKGGFLPDQWRDLRKIERDIREALAVGNSHDDLGVEIDETFG